MFDQTNNQTAKRIPDTSGYGQEGMQGELRPQSGSLCRRVQGEGHSLLRGAGGLKALGRGSGKGHPGGRVQRGEATPLAGVVGGGASCLNRARYSIPTEWMRWRSQYFALLSYGKFSNLLFRASDGTAPITPVHHALFTKKGPVFRPSLTY